MIIERPNHHLSKGEKIHNRREKAAKRREESRKPFLSFTAQNVREEKPVSEQPAFEDLIKLPYEEALRRLKAAPKLPPGHIASGHIGNDEAWSILSRVRRRITDGDITTIEGIGIAIQSVGSLNGLFTAFGSRDASVYHQSGELLDLIRANFHRLNSPKSSAQQMRHI